MYRLFLRAALALGVAFVPASALAGSVYLNGVKIDGVTNQRFEKATVRIDENGNVHIDAPGYAARVMTVAPPTPPAAPPVAPAPTAPVATTVPAPTTGAPTTGAPASPAQPGTPGAVAKTPAPTAPAAPGPAASGPARLTQRYWLVTEQTVPGMTEFDIDVYVNSKWVRKLRSNEDQVVSDITRNLTPGENTVTMIARKVVSGSRRSLSPQHVFRVIIGEGNEGGGNVMIDNPLIRFQTTAADTQDVTQEFTLTTR